MTSFIHDGMTKRSINTFGTQVDPAKLNTLKELIAGPDYKENMQKIIRTIYEFAFMTYAGLYLIEYIYLSK